MGSWVIISDNIVDITFCRLVLSTISLRVPLMCALMNNTPTLETAHPYCSEAIHAFHM